MASNGGQRRGLLTAGGVLSIIGGVLELIGGGILVGIGIEYIIGGPFRLILDIIVVIESLAIVIIVGILILVLGIIAIIGGASAIKRKRFGLSLAGAICALPSVPFGILAVIFVALGKREFGAERKEDGI
jgi:hypothetical protein